MPAALGRCRLPPQRRGRLAALLAAATALLVLCPAGPASADLLSPESGGSPNADDIDTLYWIIFWLAAIIFAGVEGLLLYSLIKFRAKKGQVPAQIRGNTRLEIGWTVGAAAILVVLAVVTFIMLGDIRNPPNSDADGFQAAGERVLYANTEEPNPPNGRKLRVVVNGQQYVWRYTYDDGDGNPLNDVFSYETLVVPTGTTVVLAIQGQDVAHSWWIPELGGKMDALPGHTNYAWFKIPASKAGTRFRGQCAELCGRNHANMIAHVEAVPPQDFEAYLARKRSDIEEANRAAAEQRRQVEGQQGAGQETP